MRRHTKKLFYGAWLRCIGRFTEGTERGAPERTRADVLHSVPALDAVTPSHRGAVTPAPSQGFQAIAPQCWQALLVDFCPVFSLPNVVTSCFPWSVVSCVDEGWTVLVWVSPLFSSLLSSPLVVVCGRHECSQHRKRSHSRNAAMRTSRVRGQTWLEDVSLYLDRVTVRFRWNYVPESPL